MSLSIDNTAILERALVRAHRLLEAEPELRRSMPSAADLDHVTGGATSIEIVQRAMERYAERPAIGERRRELVRDEESGLLVARARPAFETLSYGELWRRVARVAGGLRHLGVAAGEICLLIGFATVDHVVAELACHFLAAVSAPLAKNASAAELAAVCDECESKTVFCTVAQLAGLTRGLAERSSLSRVVAMDVFAGDEMQAKVVEAARRELAAARPELTVWTLAEVTSLGEAAIGEGKTIAPVVPGAGTPLGEDPLLTLVYTSGSTGAPKGAEMGERSWHARWSTLPFAELASLPMVSVVFLPQNHMGGRNAIANSLKLGGLAYLTQESDMSTLFDDLALVRPTYLHLVPRLSELVYQHFQSEVARRIGSGSEPESVRQQVMTEMRAGFLGGRILLALTASAPTPPEVLAFVKECFDVPVVNVFAGTEYGQLFIDGSVHRQNVLDLKLISVPELGYLESDQPYPRGELLVKTARGIARYFKNEAATRALLDADGFMRTGDIFERRGRDEMVWIDRRNNVQKLSQGEFVNLWRLEAVLTAGSRFIKQVYLHGESQRSYLLGVIVPELEELASEGPLEPGMVKARIWAEIRRLAAAQGLLPYEVPRDFLVEPEPFSRDNGLLTSLNKPARPRLKQKYGERLEQLYEGLERRGVEKREGAQDSLRGAFAAALGLAEEGLELSQSFRELGGDSMAAASLRARLQREHGVRLSVGALLRGDVTLGEALAEATAQLAATARSVSFAELHGAEATAIYARDLRLDRFFADLGQERRPGDDLGDGGGEGGGRHVLLTGATGFLGRFLCLSLLARVAERGGALTCVVRASSDAEALRRLAEVYGAGTALQERFLTLAGARLRVLAGDLEAPRFGWSAARYEQLAERVDGVVHAAALVNHALPYAELFEANVVGTAEVLRFCASGRRKRCSVVSTNSVSLALLGERELAREGDDTRALGDGWVVGEARHADGYRASKWAAEVLAQDLSERWGAEVKVFRCNLILPPQGVGTGGQINAADFFVRLIASVVAAGVYPASFYEADADPVAPPHLDGLPVDFLAESIAAISFAPPSASYAVYHLNNYHWDDGISLDTVMRRLVARGYPLTRVDDHAEWFARISRALAALDPLRRAASSLPILEQWRRPLEMARRRRVDARAFRAQVQGLRPLGHAELPQLDDAYFDRCIDDLIALRIIAPPPAPSR